MVVSSLVRKFSQIQQALGAPVAADFVVGVQAATSTDLLYTINQLATALSTTSLLRITLTASQTFNITTSGNDSTGDGSVAKPWRTLQHAVDYCSSTIDLGGGSVVVTLQLGAGSFAGAGLKQVPGNGYIRINGSGVGSTTLTAGPNDGLWNNGQCLSLIGSTTTSYYFDNLTLDNSAGTQPCVECAVGTLIIGNPAGFVPGTVNFKGNTSAWVIEAFNAPCNFADTPAGASTIGVSIPGGHCPGFFKVSDAGFVSAQSAYTISGTPAWDQSFALAYNGGQIIANNNSSFTGSATGLRFNVMSNGIIGGTNGAINLFPGNTAGVASSGGQYT